MLIALFCLLQPPAPNLKVWNYYYYFRTKNCTYIIWWREREWCHAHFLIKYLVSTPLPTPPSQFICCLVNRLWNAFLLDDELMSQAVICTVPPILILLRINNSPSPFLYCHAPIYYSMFDDIATFDDCLTMSNVRLRERKGNFFSLCLDSAIISDVFLYWNVHHVEIHWEKNNYYVVLFRENSHTLFFVLCLELAFHCTYILIAWK